MVPVDKITRQDIQRFSDILYENAEVHENAEGSGKCFFEGIPRKTAREFFGDVKFWFGNWYGIYIWDFEYEEVTA